VYGIGLFAGAVADRARVGLSAQFQQHLGQFGVLFRTAEVVVVSAIAIEKNSSPTN
jgi:hypothetical protein